jgi:hypothetical protein
MQLKSSESERSSRIRNPSSICHPERPFREGSYEATKPARSQPRSKLSSIPELSLPQFSATILAMIDTFLVPEKTVVNAKGDGPPVNVSSAANRVFLLTLNITNIIEQESLDVSIFGSADGAAWSPKPIAMFPQKFYRAQHPMLLDLTAHPEIKFLRAHWEVNRWGRGAETPMFEFHVTMREVPTEILKEATAEAKALA